MPGLAHSRDDLARFQNGEERLVFARHKAAPSDPLYYLEDGAARDRAVKAFTREHLECPMPECRDRRLTAVNRSENSGKRDGFSHLRGAGRHAPESLFHFQAKALIQAWVTRNFPDVRATLEEGTADRSRRADVMLTWPDGARAAVEIQYAALTVQAWLTRHESYLAQGITPIWLFGHHGAHMRSARFLPDGLPAGGFGAVQMALLHQRMAARGVSVLWINPVTQAVGTPWVTIEAPPGSRRFPVAVREEDTSAFLTIDRLAACDLDPQHGIVTPAGNALAASLVAYNNHLAHLAALEEERAEQQRAWEASDLHRKVRAHFNDTIPGSLEAADLPDEDGVGIYRTWWHCLIYGDLILNRRRGAQITVEECIRVLDKHQVPRRPNHVAAINAFLDHLAARQVLRIDRSRPGRAEPLITIRAHIIAESPGLRQVNPSRSTSSADDEAHRKARAARWAARKAGLLSPVAPAPRLPVGRTPFAAGTSHSAPVTGLRCVVCGGALSETLASHGRHLAC